MINPCMQDYISLRELEKQLDFIISEKEIDRERMMRVTEAMKYHRDRIAEFKARQERLAKAGIKIHY